MGFEGGGLRENRNDLCENDSRKDVRLGGESPCVAVFESEGVGGRAEVGAGRGGGGMDARLGDKVLDDVRTEI